MSEIAINKIARVVSVVSEETRWEKSFDISSQIALQSNIKLDLFTPQQITVSEEAWHYEQHPPARSKSTTEGEVYEQ